MAGLRLVLIALISITVVVSLSTVGLLMSVAMLITPAAAALLETSRVETMTILAVAIGVTSALGGPTASYHLATPPGPTIGHRRRMVRGIEMRTVPKESTLPAMSDKIPVTVLTGFLGSGKTTLLNRILTEQHGMRIAVIENEFGEIGIDDALVIDADEEIFEMNNGCICCTVRGDLIRILGNLVRRRDRFDHILIETTGLADPAPVAQTFFVDEEMKASLRLDAIVTLVDARHVTQHLDEVKPEGTENEAVEQIAFADRIVINKTDLVDELELKEVESRVRAVNGLAEVLHASYGQVDLNRILDVGAFDLSRALDLDPEFLADGEHQHDLTVTSVGIELEGELDSGRLNQWLSWLLSTQGTDIFRMKGILAVAGDERRFVFQGVHMLFDGQPDRPWGPGERRVNRLVFIGRNLDRDDLTQRFAACLA